MKKILLVVVLIGSLILAMALLRKDHIIPRDVAIEKLTCEYSKFVDMGGFKIHYTEKGEGVPVVMFHGFAGSHNNWDKLLRNFPEGYRVICPDLPGFGLSDFPELGYSNATLIDFYTETMSEFLVKLEVDSAYVLGNSMGGYMAWELALNDDRVKKLVLLNSMGYATEDIKPLLARLMTLPIADIFIKNGLPLGFAKVGAKKCFGDDTKIEEVGVESFYSYLNTEGVLGHTKRLANSVEYPDTTRITQIHQPTLIIWGDLDKIIPVEHAYKFNRDIPNNNLIIYEGSGHVPMIENSEETLRDVLDFFNQNHIAL